MARSKTHAERPSDRLTELIARLDAAAGRKTALLAIVLAGCVLRLAIGLGSHSGQAAPPMHGDFEAQRHWLEITRHLPIDKWYWYDLQWWGLDYPPLTAWHSLLLGHIGDWIEPSWFALDISRTNETIGVKTFMRFTVIASDMLTYVPAMLAYASLAPSTTSKRAITAVLLAHPALLLIDHGHFQYNGVMLGLFIVTLYFCAVRRYNLAAWAFVACITFKQMGLYYAPAIFAFLLSKTITKPQAFVALGLNTLLAFAVICGPFYLYGGLENLLQVVHRVFPFARGLFEDKVANFWCALNAVYKLKIRHSDGFLRNASLALTLLGILPPSVCIFRRSDTITLLRGSAACAWAFFLFSFQVHEKTVLVPLIPTTALLLWRPSSAPFVKLVNDVALFSIWPLLRKDGLQAAYVVLYGAWVYLTRQLANTRGESKTITEQLVSLLKPVFAASVALLTVGEQFYAVPSKPDLYVVLNCILCAAYFGLCYLWLLYSMFSEE